MNWKPKLNPVFSGWKLLLFICISLLSLCIVALQGYLLSKQSTQTIETQVNRMISENMDSLSVNITNDLNYMDDFARTLSNNAQLIHSSGLTNTERKVMTEGWLKAYSEYYRLRLPLNIQVLLNSDEVYAYPSLNVWEEKRLRNVVASFPWYDHRVSLDNDYLHWNVTSDYHANVSSNALYVTKNIISDNRSVGLLVIEMNGSLIERLLNRAQIHAQNAVFIVSGDGQLLFRNENMVKPLQKDTELLNTVTQILKRGDDHGTQNMLWADSPYYLIYKQISSTPWTMVSLIPMHSFQSDSISIWHTTAITTAISIVLITAFFGILYLKVTLPIAHLSRIVKRAGEGLTTQAYNYKGFKEIETLNRGIFRFFEQIQEQFQTIKRGESEKRKLELHRLQEQMRPHFWHNSLNSLRFLAVLNGDHTMAEAILSLTRMLDYTLRNTDVLYSSLEDEKNYAMSFVRFQEIRSMQQIRVNMELDERAIQAQIPKFTLQLILENAIVHGFAPPFDKEPYIRVVAQIEGDLLILRVTDNGSGMDQETLLRLFQPEHKPHKTRLSSGLSLINLQQRFQLEYGDGFGIHVASRAGQFTEVTMTLPLIAPDNEKEGNPA
ncbi:sensor histidine kinase [Paenibacillus vandeheii]